MNKFVLAVIPARGGSKGVPKKNIKILVDKPLIAYTINAAKGSRYINKIIVSTDDAEIKEVSKQYDAEVIDRPKELAGDFSPSIDVVLHVLKNIGNIKPDLVILLQPTSPLRTSEDIDNAIELFLNSKDALSLISITNYEKPPFWALKLKDNLISPMFGEKYFKMMRQELPEAYKPNGAIFIARPETLLKYKTYYTQKTLGYIMPYERSIDIDTEFDFKLAEFLINKSNFLN